jgi:hypothetical protein
MEYKQFLEQLIGYRKFSRDISDLYDIGFDLDSGKFNLVGPVLTMLQSSIESHYGEDGWEWTSWFIFESDYGEKDWSSSPTYKENEDGSFVKVNDKGEVRFGAYDENGEPICYSHESLWEHLEKNHKLKYKVTKRT